MCLLSRHFSIGVNYIMFIDYDFFNDYSTLYYIICKLYSGFRNKKTDTPKKNIYIILKRFSVIELILFIHISCNV